MARRRRSRTPIRVPDDADDGCKGKGKDEPEGKGKRKGKVSVAFTFQGQRFRVASEDYGP